MDEAAPFVSVIVPVLDDPRLRLCLAALEAQQYAADRYEVIVVDNGSATPIEPVVTPFPHASTAREPARSSYAARNAGAALARGDVLAFTDADCLPAADWLLRGAARTGGAGMRNPVAGRVDVFYGDPRRPRAAEVYDALTAFPQAHFVGANQFGVTANLFVPGATFAAVGPFDPTFESAGDRDWGLRAARAGFPTAYADDVVVRHPARDSLAEVTRKTRRVMGGALALRTKHGEPLPALFPSLTPPVRFIASVYANPNIPGAGLKTRVALIAVYVKYLRAWARLRAARGAR